MKKRLAIATAVAVFAATATVVMAAGLYRGGPIVAVDALPAHEIINTARSFGLQPTTQALRRGPYYVLHAIDARGLPVRVVADAQLGDIVSISLLVTPRYDSGPRIIHVPPVGARSGRPDIDDDQVAAPDADNDEAPPPRHAAPRVKHRSERWPKSQVEADSKRPVSPPRNVLSAPPPTGGLSPIYPTPRFSATSEPTEKFAAPTEHSTQTRN